jgi:hypothetical protein
MKAYIIVSILLLFAQFSFAQNKAQNSEAVGQNPSFFTQANVLAGATNNGNGNYTISVSTRPDLISFYDFSAIQATVGDVLLDPNGGLYEIRSGTYPSFTVQLLNNLNSLPEPFLGAPAPPSTPVVIARPTDECGTLPYYAFAGLGIDSRLVALVNNYNMNRLDECIGANTGGSGTSTKQVYTTKANANATLNFSALSNSNNITVLAVYVYGLQLDETEWVQTGTTSVIVFQNLGNGVPPQGASVSIVYVEN